MSNGIVVISVLFFTVGPVVGNDEHGDKATGREYMPQWSIGQQWYVEIERTSEPPSVPKEILEHWKPRKYKVVYQLKVERAIEIDGELCWQVRVDGFLINGVPIGRVEVFYRIFFRQSDGTLKMVQRLRKHDGKIAASREFASLPVDATDWVGSLPLAWPSFALEHGKHTPSVRRSHGVVIINPDECSQKQSMVSRNVGGREESVLQITLEKDGNDEKRRRTTQIWAKGKPWWVEARLERGGHQWCVARLVEKAVPGTERPK